MVPSVFVSYSHDNQSHKDWVLQLATRLRHNGVDAILDRWNLDLGQDVAAFIEKGLSKSSRVLCICSENYVGKANNTKGGVGYEKMIITAEIIANLDTDWVIPVIRNSVKDDLVPKFLSGRVYIDFRDDRLYEDKYEELLRSLLDEPVLPVPPLGMNPFENLKLYANQSFLPNSEKYASPARKGRVTFDYSNNNGRYFIGSGKYMFKTYWSKASDKRIYFIKDSESILTVAVAKDKDKISDIEDARIYEGSSEKRKPEIGQVVVLQNKNGYWAAIKVVTIKDDTRNDDSDEVVFDYVVQTNGSPHFSTTFAD